MLSVMARVAAGLFAVIAVLQCVNAVASGFWQFWVSAGALLLASWGWWKLGGTWRGSSIANPAESGRTILGRSSRPWVLVALVGMILAIAVMTTLG